LSMTDRRTRVVRRGAGGQVDDGPLLEKLDETTIEVRLPEAPDWSTQLVAEALVDLLSRLFPRLRINCPAEARSDPRLPPGPDNLHQRLEQVRGHGVSPEAPGEAGFVVGVGPGSDAADLYVDGDGWVAYLGTVPSDLGRAEAGSAVVGPLAAACRGAAHAFQLAMSGLGPALDVPRSTYWSGLNFSFGPTPLDVAERTWIPELDAVLVGAGSIGGAAVYSFARTPDLRGELQVVDPQTLVSTNPDRALLATAAVSDAERVKAEVAAEALGHHHDLRVGSHECRLDEFVAARPREDVLPLVLCAVDNLEARRSIQDCLPLDLINAACDPANSVVSGHRTGSGPCVMCLFMSRIMDREQALFRLIARETGLMNERMVAGMMAARAPLGRQHLRAIEDFRGLPDGALADYEGKILRDLWHGRLAYGEQRIETEQGAVVEVAAPWVTALAGVLLASEALKAGAPTLNADRLGPLPGAPGIRYGESVYASPEFSQLTTPRRWSGEECLCNSPWRRRLIVERYGLEQADYPI
jgi:hypothetical protein